MGMSHFTPQKCRKPLSIANILPWEHAGRPTIVRWFMTFVRSPLPNATSTTLANHVYILIKGAAETAAIVVSTMIRMTGRHLPDQIWNQVMSRVRVGFPMPMVGVLLRGGPFLSRWQRTHRHRTSLKTPTTPVGPLTLAQSRSRTAHPDLPM
jgi:hypothetical protein